MVETKTPYKLNANHLNIGIRFWLTKKKKWPRDFHNSFYKDLIDLHSTGINPIWWNKMVDILWSWVAIRPKSKQFVLDRGYTKLPDFAKNYDLVLNKVNQAKTHFMTNGDLDWQDVSALFSIAYDIKAVTSPVFASKLCHFMIPSIFPVIDQEVLGGSNNYKDYWLFCHSLWEECANKDELSGILRDKIGEGIIANYPWSTKVVELVLIGKRLSGA